MMITQASVADVSAICALVNSAYRGENSRKGWTTEADLLDGIRIDQEMLQDYFEDGDTTILKYVDNEGQLAGCVYLKKKHEQLYLGMLTVSPTLQGKGIGKLLLQASEDKARHLGCTSIVMTVITSRHELIEWYKRHGYAETGEKEAFPTSERFGKPKFALEFLVMQKSV